MESPALPGIGTTETSVAKSHARSGDEQQFVEEMMYLLRAPLVGTPGWVDILRDRWSDALIQRLARHKDIFAARQCTEYEAMLYLSTASLEAPLPHGWAELYFWLFSRWNPKAASENDIPSPELDRSQKDDLARLRGWIFARQMERLKQPRKAGDGGHAPVGTGHGLSAPQGGDAAEPDLMQAKLF